VLIFVLPFLLPLGRLFCQNSQTKRLIYKDFFTLALIDCQQNTSHLASLGGREIARKAFIAHVRAAVEAPPIPWRFDKEVLSDLLSKQSIIPIP